MARTVTRERERNIDPTDARGQFSLTTRNQSGGGVLNMAKTAKKAPAKAAAKAKPKTIRKAVKKAAPTTTRRKIAKKAKR